MQAKTSASSTATASTSARSIDIIGAASRYDPRRFREEDVAGTVQERDRSGRSAGRRELRRRIRLVGGPGLPLPTSQERTVTDHELLDAIAANPEDDDLRVQYAERCRTSDPERARFIDLQMARARRRRGGDFSEPTNEEVALRKKRGADWAHTIAKYSPRYEFDRGMVEEIAIDPHLFLERGEWLYKNAPIRHVWFGRQADPGPFPLADVLGSPLLAHLDTIVMQSKRFDDTAAESLARCPHLTRCLILDLTGNRLAIRGFTALAASPTTRRMLQIAVAPDAYHPGQRFQPTDAMDSAGADIWDWSDVSDEGKALERQYGYVPWLHSQNWVLRLDARWLVDRGVVPVKPAGSPM